MKRQKKKKSNNRLIARRKNHAIYSRCESFQSTTDFCLPARHHSNSSNCFDTHCNRWIYVFPIQKLRAVMNDARVLRNRFRKMERRERNNCFAGLLCIIFWLIAIKWAVIVTSAVLTAVIKIDSREFCESRTYCPIPCAELMNAGPGERNNAVVAGGLPTIKAEKYGAAFFSLLSDSACLGRPWQSGPDSRWMYLYYFWHSRNFTPEKLIDMIVLMDERLLDSSTCCIYRV